jgi:hypothetical protein
VCYIVSLRREGINRHRGKFILLVLLLLFGSCIAAFGNVAAPSRAIEGQGDIFQIGGSPLVVEREELVFDFSEYDGSPNSPSPCTARYFIANPTEKPVSQRLYFLSPAVTDVEVFADGELLSAESVMIDQQLKDALREAGISTGREIEKAVLFNAELGPGGKAEFEVRFSILPGWDIKVAEFGPTAPQAAHLTNNFKMYTPPTWYVYNLNAARTFSSFGELEVRILLPEGKDLIANMDFARESAENGGIVRYTAKTEGIPAENLDIKLIHNTRFNSIGGSAALGMSIGFDGRGVGFIVSGLFDISLANHMISIGAESHPFRRSLRGILRYTIFPPGKMGWSPVAFFDLRGGIALILTVLPEPVFGGRLFGGIRFGPIAFEVGYEHFFIGAVSTMRNGLVLSWAVGI